MFQHAVVVITGGAQGIGKDHIRRPMQQHLSGRVGIPEDIALACLYLTNPTNSFVTGINLTVDGGMTKKMLYEE